MTSEQFIYWLKGYMAAQIDCQIKLDIEKALATVETRNHSYVGYRENFAASNTATLSTSAKKELLTDSRS